MHTKVSSLTANFEKLEYLLADLDFHFDVIACAETWNPEDKKIYLHQAFFMVTIDMKELLGIA